MKKKTKAKVKTKPDFLLERVKQVKNELKSEFRKSFLKLNRFLNSMEGQYENN